MALITSANRKGQVNPAIRGVYEALETVLPDTAGTQEASKVISNDANSNQGIIKCTEFHLGTSGAEVQLTATPAEINAICDGANTVTDVSSTTVTIPAIGVANITITDTKTINIATPVAGQTVHIICTASGTNVKTVTHATAGVTFDGSSTNLTFNAANEAVTLVGLSTTRYAVMSNTNSVGLS